MTDLIQRIESAKEPRRELFEEAGQLLHGPYRTDWSGRNFYRFTAMLDAQAWTSAAEMLVPDGCLHTARTLWADPDTPLPQAAGYANIDRYSIDDRGLLWWKENFPGIASHPSLALLAAILRAERKDDE